MMGNLSFEYNLMHLFLGKYSMQFAAEQPPSGPHTQSPPLVSVPLYPPSGSTQQFVFNHKPLLRSSSQIKMVGEFCMWLLATKVRFLMECFNNRRYSSIPCVLSVYRVYFPCNQHLDYQNDKLKYTNPAKGILDFCKQTGTRPWNMYNLMLNCWNLNGNGNENEREHETCTNLKKPPPLTGGA